MPDRVQANVLIARGKAEMRLEARRTPDVPSSTGVANKRAAASAERQPWAVLEPGDG